MPTKPQPTNPQLKLEVVHARKDESSQPEAGDPLRPARRVCGVFSHNLSEEDASQELDQLRHEGLFAFTVDQGSHHAAGDPDDCTLCRAELARTCPQDT